MNRQDDLSVVFDKTWKANHNDDIKKVKEKEKNFMDKMFNSPSNMRGTIRNNPMNNLQSNMASANEINRQSRVNNIIKKWK